MMAGTGLHALLRTPFHAFPKRCEFCSLTSNKPAIDVNLCLRLLSSTKDLKSILQVHGRFIVSGLKQDNAANTHLINAYALTQRCNFARYVFDSVPNTSLVLWNSMIRAYTRGGQHKEAIKIYRCLLAKGLEPDRYTFTFVLKACTAALDFREGVLVHREIAKRRLECDAFVGTGLVDMYCKMGNLWSAREVFDKIVDKDIVAWNAMIAGLAQSADCYEAFVFLKSMQMGGVEPDLVSLLNLVPAVSKLADIGLCRSVHGYATRRGFGCVISNGLIDMYSKCGDVDMASRVFEQMQGKDDVSWGTMMAGYAHNGCFLEVLDLFDCMKGENIKMNKTSIVCGLLAASEMRDLERGREIHYCAIQQGIDSDVLVATPIMTMYAKCEELGKAKQLLMGLQKRDLVAWSAIIGVFVQSGYPEEALSLFRDMQKECLRPNKVTLINVLPACADPLAPRLGKSIHCYAVKTKVDSDISTGTALVSMYTKCGFFTPALTVFNRLPCKDVVTWNALINGYTQIGDPYHTMETFHSLQLSGIHPDSGTMVSLLAACALFNDLPQGFCVQGQIIKCGFESDSHVKNALIDMYAKCGKLSSAEFLFTESQFTKNEISWNILIAGYMQNGHAREALSVFYLMKLENFQPNLVTIVSVLPAAAYLAALREGMIVHACIIRMGFQSYTLVGNSLTDMYAKCGRLDYSENCFNEIKFKDTVSWNSMLAGYAIHGQGNRAVELFSLMQQCHIAVNSVSFVCVLSACRHAGLLDEGRKIFNSMRERHHLEPNLEHYACMVDLLGHAGLFDEILCLIKDMPMEPDAGVWGALLAACRMHSNVQLGEVALNHLVKLEPESPAHYVVLSNIYSRSERWGDAGNTRTKMNDSGLKKTPGCSWVETKNRVHAFLAGDQKCT